ncbi:hypothetical protein COOONC_02803 [Cooperia oncophora]
MAVRSHKEFDDHGLDFVLTYFDNPEASIPRSVYNWMVNHGGPYFLRQVHAAARDAERSGRELTWTSDRIAKCRHKALKKIDTALIKEESEEDEADESELVDAVQPTSKAHKFTFTSVDTKLPAETYVNA